jgi:hypothetical protein
MYLKRPVCRENVLLGSLPTDTIGRIGNNDIKGVVVELVVW